MADLNWLWASFIIVVLFGIISLVLGWIEINISPLVEKIIVGCSILILLPAFRQYEYYSFLDLDKNFLAIVRVNAQNKQSVLDAIRLIKKNTKLTSEMYFDDALPNTSSVFEFTEFDFADFFNKSKIVIYDDKIINVEKSLFEETTTVIRFDELSGKTKFAKMGNDKWDIFSSYWLFLVCITGISVSTFFTEQIRGNDLVFNLFIGGLALIIPLYLLRFIKSEILVFYDKQDNDVFWTRVNKSNREKINQIVEFITGKVESQT